MEACDNYLYNIYIYSIKCYIGIVSPDAFKTRRFWGDIKIILIKVKKSYS